MRDAFLKIFKEYENARTNNFNGHHLAGFIRNDFKDIIQNNFSSWNNLIWKSSPGMMGRWTDAPWLAIFNPIITESAQNGYYPVFLYDYPLNNVYLSMNQGMTNLKREFGAAKSREMLKARALIFKERIKQEYSEYFNGNAINLHHRGPSTRLAFYEPGHSFGKKYNKNDFPSDDELIDDINNMLYLYELILQRGGYETLDENINYDEIGTTNDELLLEEKRRIAYHRKIEGRNSTLSKKAKEIHGYKCQVCNFDFEKHYGDLGPYVEAHHKIPLSQLFSNGNESISLSPRNDFAVLCANCHRMIHRTDSPEDFEEFVKYYKKINKT